MSSIATVFFEALYLLSFVILKRHLNGTGSSIA